MLLQTVMSKCILWPFEAPFNLALVPWLVVSDCAEYNYDGTVSGMKCHWMFCEHEDGLCHFDNLTLVHCLFCGTVLILQCIFASD